MPQVPELKTAVWGVTWGGEILPSRFIYGKKGYGC